MTTNRGNPYVAGISAALVIATILVHFFGVRHPYMTTYFGCGNAPIPYR